MKRYLLLLLLSLSARSFAQNGCGETLTSASPTCQVIGAGKLNPVWTVISRHGEYAQNETECNIPNAITSTSGGQDSGGLTITTSHTSYACGDFNTNGTVLDAAASWPYTTGDIQWGSLTFTTGTVKWRTKVPSYTTGLWPGWLWFLDSRCQTQNIYNGSASACSGSSYAEFDASEFLTNGSYAGTWPSISSYNGGTPNTCDAAQTPIDQSYHTYSFQRSTGSIGPVTIDGVTTGCSFSGGSVSNNPLFAIIQIQTSTTEGPPVNSLLPASAQMDYLQVYNSSGTLTFSDNFRANIFFAQVSAGQDSGDDCADARAISSMLAMDWTAGNNLHLCGTYTIVPTALGSGVSGTPITVTYESGASGPCPNLAGQTYIVVMGGNCSTSSVAPTPWMA